MLGRLVRFGLTGGLTTAMSYLVFVGLMRLGLHYAPCAVASWGAGLAIGFAVNRRFTFGISGAAGRSREFALYALGALLQLLVGLGMYAVTIGAMRLGSTLAFVLNLPVTTAVSFLFMSLVTFRRVAPLKAGEL